MGYPVDVVALVSDAVCRGGMKWFRKNNDLNLVGIRNTVQQAGAFDDRFLAHFASSCGPVTMFFRGTTDPGRHFLVQPMRESGCAVLQPGQYRGMYKLGLHKGREALVQSVPVKIRRDLDHDTIVDPTGPIETGWFGINFHDPGREGDASGVEWASAGCQVPLLARYVALVRGMLSEQIAAGLGDSVTYTLLALAEHPSLLPLFSFDPEPLNVR